MSKAGNRVLVSVFLLGIVVTFSSALLVAFFYYFSELSPGLTALSLLVSGGLQIVAFVSVQRYKKAFVWPGALLLLASLSAVWAGIAGFSTIYGLPVPFIQHILEGKFIPPMNFAVMPLVAVGLMSGIGYFVLGVHRIVKDALAISQNGGIRSNSVPAEEGVFQKELLPKPADSETPAENTEPVFVPVEEADAQEVDLFEVRREESFSYGDLGSEHADLSVDDLRQHILLDYDDEAPTEEPSQAELLQQEFDDLEKMRDTAVLLAIDQPKEPEEEPAEETPAEEEGTTEELSPEGSPEEKEPYVPSPAAARIFPPELLSDTDIAVELSAKKIRLLRLNREQMDEFTLDFSALMQRLGLQAEAYVWAEGQQEYWQALQAELANTPQRLKWSAPWLIVERKTGKLTGMAAFVPAEEGAEHRLELQVYITPDFRRWGMGSRTFKTLLQWAKAQPDIEGLMAVCLAEDVAAQRVLEKAGMENVRQQSPYLFWAQSFHT